MLHADSIHFDDSLKYVTPGGKIVYGGGGIMPDIFIPIQTGDNLAYYNRLINRGVIYDFAFDYADTHRNELKKYSDYKAYKNQFVVTDNMLDDLAAYAAENGIKKDEQGFKAMRDDIRILLKALIGRNVLDDEGFYPVYHQKDETFQQAVNWLEHQKITS